MQGPNPHIFYTDDDEDDLELFRVALSEVDDSMILTTTDNGDELMNILEQASAAPRVIFLDLNMPRRNGYEVLEAMRSHEKLKEYPVVIFSTTSDESAINRTLTLGANLFVPKPRSFTGIKEAIQSCLNMNWAQFKPEPENFILRLA